MWCYVRKRLISRIIKRDKRVKQNERRCLYLGNWRNFKIIWHWRIKKIVKNIREQINNFQIAKWIAWWNES